MTNPDLIRAYYFDPPPPDPEHQPSDEELIARYERQRYDQCVRLGGDPIAAGLGPHGSLIGGPDKPLTIHPCRAEHAVPFSPLPLSWWDYPYARRRFLPSGGERAAHAYLGDMSGLYLAGIANRPSGPRLAEMFRSPAPSEPDLAILTHLLSAISEVSFYRLNSRGGVALYELARALHRTRVRRNPLVRWINRRAIRPEGRGDV